MMKIVRLKTKTKIILEYSTRDKNINFAWLDPDYLNIRVFLRNGKEITTSQIDTITINAREI